MEISQYHFTDIYRKNGSDNQINLVFIDNSNPSEALIFCKFSFYCINLSLEPNFSGFSPFYFFEDDNHKSGNSFTITGIKATDINDIIYIQLDHRHLLVLTQTFDNYSGDSYSFLRFVQSENSPIMQPLSITEFEKFDNDFKSENFVDVLDLRFK